MGTPWYTLTGPLSKGESGGGRQCTDTQDLYLKIREEEGIQGTDTKDLYPEGRGEEGDSVQTLRTSI